MKKSRVFGFLCLFLLLGMCMTAHAEEPQKVRVLIIPKFEIGEMSGDMPGEAQLFYEKYCPGAEDIRVAHLPEYAHFYYNAENGTAILLTGAGKTAAALSLTAVLSDSAYDFSDAYIVSVGCAGGAIETCTLGDVVLLTAACDNELGHTADIREFDDKDSEVTWFYDGSFDHVACRMLNAELCEKAYEMAKDVPMQTTEVSQRVLAANFPDEAWAARDPMVLKGSTITGDSFWKGIYGHKNAHYIVEKYGCTDPYAVTEMEEGAIANAAACYGLLDRLISFRVIVNLDVFLQGESPERLWGEEISYGEKVETENSETLDIFVPGMQNLFDAAEKVIDAALSGELNE